MVVGVGGEEEYGGISKTVWEQERRERAGQKRDQEKIRDEVLSSWLAAPGGPPRPPVAGCCCAATGQCRNFLPCLPCKSSIRPKASHSGAGKVGDSGDGQANQRLQVSHFQRANSGLAGTVVRRVGHCSLFLRQTQRLAAGAPQGATGDPLGSWGTKQTRLLSCNGTAGNQPAALCSRLQQAVSPLQPTGMDPHHKPLTAFAGPRLAETGHAIFLARPMLANPRSELSRTHGNPRPSVPLPQRPPHASLPPADSTTSRIPHRVFLSAVGAPS